MEKRNSQAIRRLLQFLDIMRNLSVLKMDRNPGNVQVGQTTQEAMDIVWAEEEGNRNPI